MTFQLTMSTITRYKRIHPGFPGIQNLGALRRKERTTQMKVLIIDDEEDTRSIASMSLSILGGLEVVEAENGSVGINVATQEKPDVILLDMMMPIMDGPSTLEALRSNEHTKDIPVIFLTAKAMTAEIDKLKRMGARGVLTKPFDPTILANQVKEILEG